jgi:hypothetical protein
MESSDLNVNDGTSARAVQILLFPAGNRNRRRSLISSRFVDEREIDAWIRALKSDLDEAAEGAKRALRDG